MGYIFEKYINQKDMGAYYTKEDITEYISKNTIIPFIFETTQHRYKAGFEGEQSVWRLLQREPERYIYPAVSKGMELPLPIEIAAGLNDVSKRTRWNKPALEEYSLPTEIWREVVARRKRYEEVRTKLANGKIRDINDLITDNLDIRQFAQDVIENCESPDLLRAFWLTIVGRIPEKSNERFEYGVTILDPTCGSGAFLFSALNILEPLYEACLDRMQVFVDELEHSGEKHRSDKMSDFHRILNQMNDKQHHPNRQYFILKSIILNNLFGVDIMEEAVEICKLRLFLKLVAQVESVDRIEPLPDIDFNIRAGNTLVGFTTHDEVKKAVTSEVTGKSKGQFKIPFDDTMQRIDENAEIADRAFRMFQEMQTKREMDTKKFADAKRELRQRLNALENELNRYLAKEYRIDVDNQPAYQKWLASYKPFHWFIEFYGIINDGGFDVIIGNPPYVEYPKVRDEYQLFGYETINCNNLYAFVTERSVSLLCQDGLSGFIVPISAFSNQSMQDMQKFLKRFDIYLSLFHQRPAQLFDGVLQRLSIFLFKNRAALTPKTPYYHTTTVKRWYSEARDTLFPTLTYTLTPQGNQPHILKMGEPIEVSILEKLLFQKEIKIYLSPNHRQEKNFIAYRTAGGGYWVTILNSKFETESLSNKTSAFLPSYDARVFMAALNSNLFWWYYFINYDLFNLKDYMLFSFRLTYPDKLEKILINLAQRLEQELLSNSIRYLIKSKTRGDAYTLKYQNFKSKPLIDEIDRVLAQHYGFTDEELDFIINYDIKYRMGQGRNAEEDDAHE